MKKILTLAILVIAGLTSKAQIEKVTYRGAFAPAPAAPWTDTWTEWDPQNRVYPSTTAAPAGGSLIKVPTSGSGYVISANTTWTKNNTYIIAGLVYVKAGVTLTIEAGTTIFGSNAYPNSSLVVTKGAKLIANGTPDQPIVFTSMYPVGQRHPGDWGGIILLGKAPYNGISSATSPVPNTFGINYIEGITEVNNSATTGESTEFGGGSTPVPNDNSGSLKYVRIEFGGYIFAQNKEINGLTFGGVGNGTTIDYVQCSYINDDAFEWFGGNVNCSHLISYRGVDDEWDTDNGFSGAVQYCLGVRDPQIGDNSYSLASGGSTSEGYESDNDANGSNNNPRTKALFTNITNIGPLRGDNSAAMIASIHPAFRRSARIRRNSELKIFNSILADYPTGLMVDNALGNTGQAYVDGRAKFKFNILSGNKIGGLTETAGTLPTGFNARDFVYANNNDSTSRADSYLVAPYGVDTTHTLASWNINAFKTADYRPNADTTLLAGHGADFTDTAFNNFSLVTCPTIPKPSAIAGTSFSVSSAADTLKTFSVDPIAGADAYVWGITGAAAGNKIKSGFGSNTVTFIVKSVPATVFVSATNYCNQSDTSAATIACALNPTTPTSITGVKNIYNCVSTLQTYKVAAVAGNTYSWAVTGTGNQLVSSAADSAVFAMVAAGNITVTAKTACNQTGVSFVQAISKTTVANPTTLTGVALVSNVCGARVWRYTAPPLPAGATGFYWYLNGISGNLGASVDSGVLSGASARYIRIKYSGNVAAGPTDSLKVAFTYDCGVTGTKGLKLALTALNPPAAPTAITITSLGAIDCGNPRYRYSVPATPFATTTAGAATGYDWTFVGSYIAGTDYVVDSGTLSSRIVVLKFLTGRAKAIGDSAKCRYTSDCGFGAYKVLTLSNTAVGSSAPAKPASITIAIVDTTICGGRKYRYTAPTLPVATATYAAATGYIWILPATDIGAVLDSGTLNSKVIVVRYTNNRAAVTGDSMYLQYSSACGLSPIKGQKLTNLVKTNCLIGAPVYSKSAVNAEGVKAQVYPNPNNGIFNVRIETGLVSKAPATIQIFDMNGRLVTTMTAQNNNGLISEYINNSRLSNGVYTVRYTVGNVTNALKMVVQK